MKNEKGFSLIEVLISIAVLGIIAVGISGGLSTASKSVLLTDTRETAKNLAEYEMEYLKGVPFAATYTPTALPSGSSGYSAVVSVQVMQPDGNLQKLSVSIIRNSKTIITLEGYKVNVKTP